MAEEIRVERQAGALGAIVTGVDLSRPFDEGSFGLLHRAFLEHHVMALRGQRITPGQQLAFAERWGKVFVHPYVPSLEGHPGVMEIYQAHPITETWHADTTFAQYPPKITMLLAQRIPPVGGDTMFANQHLAYDRLSETMKGVLEGLRALHHGTELASEAGLDAKTLVTAHPIVRRHYETGRKALFVNANYTRSIEGMTPEESRPLLEFLYAHAARLDFTYRHRWQVGDLLMWDNRSVQHRVLADYGGSPRILHRVTLEGDPEP